MKLFEQETQPGPTRESLPRLISKDGADQLVNVMFGYMKGTPNKALVMRVAHGDTWEDMDLVSDADCCGKLRERSVHYAVARRAQTRNLGLECSQRLLDLWSLLDL